MTRNILRRLFALLVAGTVLACAGSAHAYPTGSKVKVDAIFKSSLYFNAQSCVEDTHVILYPSTSACGGGANEHWQFEELKNGYDVIYSNYGSGGDECLNVAGGNYALRTYIYAWQCNPKAPTENEEFRRPENTGSPIGGDWLVPGRQPKVNQFCLNAQGGLNEGAHIILWECEGVEDESWWFE